MTEPETARQFLTFKVDDRHYALPAEDVAEIIRVPPVASVPQGPKSLLGLANLRGAVIPVASLRRLLGKDAIDPASGRAIVLSGAAHVALTVDSVQTLVSVAASQLETRQAELTAEPGEQLRGAFLGTDDAVTKILDIQPLLAKAFAPRARPAKQIRSNAAGELARDAAVASNDQKLLTFLIAGQEYAFELDAVREIIPAPEAYAVDPHSESLVIGVSAYRDTLLPLLSLRGLLGFTPNQQDKAQEKILVIAIGSLLVGLLVDRTRSVLAADPHLLEQPSAVLAARSGGESQIKAIYRGDGGRRLISILSPDRLFREEIMQRLETRHGLVKKDDGETRIEIKKLKFLIFRLGHEEFALPIDAVDEVASVPDQITRLPKTPDFLEGVINLRGAVLPVIDQRQRFDMPKLAQGSMRRLIVARSGRHRAGLLVDSIVEVLSSAEDAIEPAPDMTGEDTQLVSGVINLEKTERMILLLDPAKLLSHAERGLIDSFDAEAKQDAL